MSGGPWMKETAVSAALTSLAFEVRPQCVRPRSPLSRGPAVDAQDRNKIEKGRKKRDAAKAARKAQRRRK